MSGQVHMEGSIIDFWPDPVPVTQGYVAGIPAGGTALVVVYRDCWTIKTELRRVRLTGNRYVVLDDTG